MNPEIILVPISERECMDLVAYDPSLNDEIEMTRDGIKAIILSSIVNGLSEWIMTAKDRSEYIYIVPGEIRERYVLNSHVEYVIS